jgi:hypothetical protein
MLLYTARPEFRADWPLRAHHMQITLNRLTTRNVRQMIAQVAARPFRDLLRQFPRPRQEFVARNALAYHTTFWLDGGRVGRKRIARLRDAGGSAEYADASGSQMRERAPRGQRRTCSNATWSPR